MRGVTWVIFEEVKSGDWGIAGEPITTEKVQPFRTPDDGTGSACVHRRPNQYCPGAVVLTLEAGT